MGDREMALGSREGGSGPESLCLFCRARGGPSAPCPRCARHIGTRPCISHKEVEGTSLFSRNPLHPHPIFYPPPHLLGLRLLTSR